MIELTATTLVKHPSLFISNGTKLSTGKSPNTATHTCGVGRCYVDWVKWSNQMNNGQLSKRQETRLDPPYLLTNSPIIDCRPRV